VDGVDGDGTTVSPVVTVQVSALPGRPPAFVSPHAAAVWRRVCPDPSPLLGLDVAVAEPCPGQLLSRRDAYLATVQEHYYDDPPQIERGWREHLVDTRAQVYVDVVNNVATTGHAHPALTAAATRQWSLLNTNSRFHYGAAVELAERLANLAPDGLDQVFLVNSGSEAVDLALRLAMTATGRPRILAAREAYHGWTLGSDAITTSLGDNPRALETRPDWVELIDAPNAVRGTHRGPRAAAGYLADLDAQLAGLDTSRIAGVILEPIFGNGGGVLLPDGYLAGVFDRVRAVGGVCISDEVQMGYGRLGHHFWGFEQQGAVPDVITVAKAMGNGQPLGAVITTRAIAQAFAAEGSFFSSAGGSPVSSAIGLAVLDVMAAEHLQENARSVGEALRSGLEALASTYDVIGAVHGMGLYLGVELVTDRASFTPATGLANAVCEALLDEGCIVQPTGDHKNVLKIKPPLVMTRASATFVTEALDRVLGRLS
jgi:4-aminobutyrate aminotransferase-like enzyme